MGIVDVMRVKQPFTLCMFLDKKSFGLKDGERDGWKWAKLGEMGTSVKVFTIKMVKKGKNGVTQF